MISDGLALQFASTHLRNDRDIIIRAVRSNYNVLQFVSDDLRADEKFMLIAIKNDAHSLKFAAESLLTNNEFLRKSSELNQCQHTKSVN